MSTVHSMPEFVFGNGDAFEGVRDCLPAGILALADAAGDILGIAPGDMVAGCLATLGAVLGQSFRFDDGTRELSLPFSLVVMSKSEGSPQWLSTLRKASQVEVADNPQASSKTRLTSYGALLDFVHVRRVLSRSLDHVHTLVDGPLDPALCWMRLPAAQRSALIELLHAGWQGKAVDLGREGHEIPAVLSCLWHATEESVREAWFSKGQNIQPPLFFYQEKGEPRRLPRVEDSRFVAWSKLLRIASDMRQNSPDQSPLALLPRGREVVEEFFREHTEALTKVSTSVRPWLWWTSSLPLRLYPILITCRVLQSAGNLLDGQVSEGDRGESMEDRQLRLMKAAVRLARWLIQEHYQAISAYSAATITAGAQSDADSTDMTALEEDILTKLKFKGPQDPRDLQRGFHDLSARERDKALARLKSTGRVVESADGRLEAAA